MTGRWKRAFHVHRCQRRKIQTDYAKGTSLVRCRWDYDDDEKTTETQKKVRGSNKDRKKVNKSEIENKREKEKKKQNKIQKEQFKSYR